MQASPATQATTLPAPRVAQAFAHRGAHGLRVAKLRTTRGAALQRLFAGLLLALPCSHEALAAPQGHALLHPVDGYQVRHAGAPVGRGLLAQQPGADWISRLVEFLSLVPPQCRAVAQQNAQQECGKRDKGVLERLKHDHPVLFNLAVAGATLLAGFYIGGGFGGGKK